MRPRSADAAFLDRDADLMRGKRLADQFLVERLRKAQVDHARRQPAPFERVGGLERLRQSRAEREDRDGLALPHDASLADLQLLGNRGPDRKRTRLNSRYSCAARMPSYACK